MASLTSATVEGCEYEKKGSTAVDVIDDGGGSRKSSPVIDDGGDIELNSSGNSSPDTAAVDGNYSGRREGVGLEDALEAVGERIHRLFERAILRWWEGVGHQVNVMDPIYLGRLVRFPVTDFESGGGREERRSNGQEVGNYLEEDELFALRERLVRGYYVREGIGAFTPTEIESGILQAGVVSHYTFLSTEQLEHAFHALGLGVTDVPRYLRDNTWGRTRLPNGMFGQVEPGNWETGRLITGMRFGRGLAELTPTCPEFRLEIMDHVAEPEVANPTSIMSEEEQPPHSRFNQAMIVLYVALELSAMAFVIKYEESQMVAYFSMSTVCYLSAMYTAHLLAPLEGGNERFSVYLRGSSFVFLGLLRFLGVNQGSFVTALKIILGMSQVVLYWWTSGILQTYMNAFGMRRT